MSIVRVLCVFARLDRGGGETMCMNLYRSMDRKKIQFDFIKHTLDKCDYDDEIISMGGKIYSAPKYKIFNQFKYEKWWKSFFRKHPEYTIIHAHYSTIAAIYFKIAKKKNLITIVHSHTSNPKRINFVGKIKDYISFKVNDYSDYCFACSELAGEWLFKGRDFKVIKNAIDSSKYLFDLNIRNKIREELKIGDNFIIGTVGRISSEKNPFGTIEIFNEIHKLDSNSKFIWCGCGDLELEVKNKVDELGLRNDVLFLGVRSDINVVLQAMDVYIMTSFFEGLPVAAIEAQAAGLPCVFSDGITKEADITGDCIFVPLSNRKEWIESIYKLKNNKHKINYSKIVNAGYDINNSAKWLQEFYLKIYSDHQAK